MSQTVFSLISGESGATRAESEHVRAYGAVMCFLFVDGLARRGSCWDGEGRWVVLTSDVLLLPRAQFRAGVGAEILT